MRKATPIIAVALCYALPYATFAAESQVGYSVTYSGGSLPTVKGGEGLKLRIDNNRVRLSHKNEDVVAIPANAITEVTYGEEVHHRIGTAAGLAVVSLGIGAIVAFSKSKKHYIGITWADGDAKGGIVLEADKNEYRGLLAALEGVSGKRANDTASPKASAKASTPAAQPGQKVPDQASALVPDATEKVAATEVQQGIVVRFTSRPPNAEVTADGVYWGTTPTASLTRLPAGTHTIVVKRLGYKPWERKIDLAVGDDRTVNVELEVDPSKPQVAGL